MPVKFVSRTLKPNELNYSVVEKEFLALMRVLRRLSQWAAVLSPRRLKIIHSSKGEEAILGTLAASITPRSFVDTVLEEIAPRKRASKVAVIPVPVVTPDEELHVMTFGGSAKAKREGGAFSAVV
ncbi:hypothetical protein ON010_g12270 [Phytophthora cinnamomi]|nr:hypothetical protein ON010_g12270 [Phytophthora cinnamomi]